MGSKKAKYGTGNFLPNGQGDISLIAMDPTETIRGACTSTQTSGPPALGIRGGPVDSAHFHHHPTLTRPSPQQDQWRLGGKLKHPFLPNSNNELSPTQVSRGQWKTWIAIWQ